MKPELISADRLARAATFACKAHDGQTRDDGKTPYAIHLFRVVEYLRSIAMERDEDVLCAGFLHDTIEDTGHTFDSVAGPFGPIVASLVTELTNDNRLPKAQRRAAMIEHIPHISPRAKRIKLADRLDNVTDLLRSGNASKEKCERYIRETAQIIKACESACPPLEASLSAAHDELKQHYAHRFATSE
jgi:(p)ppGpp synthase/HD superfamily hydrolase